MFVSSSVFSPKISVVDISSRFALNRLYLEDRADLKHTVATRRIRLSYPEVLISWQITGIGNSCCNFYPPPTCREVSGLPQALEKFCKNTFLEC